MYLDAKTYLKGNHTKAHRLFERGVVEKINLTPGSEHAFVVEAVDGYFALWTDEGKHPLSATKGLEFLTIAESPVNGNPELHYFIQQQEGQGKHPVVSSQLTRVGMKLDNESFLYLPKPEKTWKGTSMVLPQGLGYVTHAQAIDARQLQKILRDMK